MRLSWLLILSLLAVLLAGAPAPAQPVGSAVAQAAANKCAAAPQEAAQVGLCFPAVVLNRFDPADVDYNLTMASRPYKLRCYQAFGLNCTGKEGTFTAQISATDLNVTTSTAGLVMPWQGASPPLRTTGASPIAAGTHVTGYASGAPTFTVSAGATAGTSQTLSVTGGSCPANTHAPMALFDTTLGAPSLATLVGYYSSCATGTIAFPPNQLGTGNVTAAINVTSGDTITAVGGIGHYTIDVSQTVASESMNTPTFWENPDGTLTLVADGNSFGATLSPSTIVSSKVKGQSYRTPLYLEAVAKFPANCPFSGFAWPAMVWTTSHYADQQSITRLQMLFQVSGNGHHVEIDWEYFVCLFSNPNNAIVGTPIHWYNYPNATQTRFQGTQPTTTSATLGSAFHKYGLLITKTKICWYFDDALIGSCQAYGPFVSQTGQANGTISTSSPTITMRDANPGDVANPKFAYDLDAAANLGIVSSYGVAGGAALIDVAQCTASGATTCQITVPAGGIPSGTTVVVDTAEDSGINSTQPLVADDGVNSYTRDASCNHGNFETRAAIFHSTLTTGLTAGQHITVTFATATFGNAYAKRSGAITGVDGVGKCTNYPTGGAGPFAAGSGGGTANDVFDGFAIAKGAAPTLVQPADFGALGCTASFSTTICGGLLETAATAHNYSPTASGMSVSVSSAMVAYTSSGGAGTPSVTLTANALANGVGSHDNIAFTDGPTPVFNSTWLYSPVGLPNQSDQNPKLGTDPQHPITYQSFKIYTTGPTAVTNRFVAANDNDDLSLENMFKRAMGGR